MSAPTDQPHTVLDHNERRETIVGWMVVVILVAFMLFRALLYIRLFGLGNPPRHWQYRTTPSLPAQTYSSTRPASTSTKVEKQITLPPSRAKGQAK